MAARARARRRASRIGSVAPTVVRLPRTEAALAAGARHRRRGARIARAEIHPIDDLRSTADYRRSVAGNLLRRFWRTAARMTDVILRGRRVVTPRGSPAGVRFTYRSGRITAVEDVRRLSAPAYRSPTRAMS